MTEPLEAGRELDSDVATRVMGWTGCDHGDVRDGYWWKRPDGAHVWPFDWRPSTSIADAWSVVEKMAREGFAFSLYVGPTDGRAFAGFNCPYGPCERHDTDFDNWHGARDVRGATAAEAICRAALKAVGAMP